MIRHWFGALRPAAALLLLSLLPICARATPGTQVVVDPATLTVTTPAAFTLNIAVNNVAALHAASVTCTFDPAILSYSTAAPGSFLTNAIMMTPRIAHGPVYDSVVVDQAILGASSVSGSGVLVVLTFVPVKAGITPVGLRNVLLLGGANFATAIPAATIDGEVIAESTVPVTVSSFAAHIVGATGAVSVEWSTLSEINNYGFEIDRRRDGDATFIFVPNSFIAGNGTTLQPNTYSFIDNTIPGPGRYEYRLRQIDQDGTEHLFEGAWVDVVLSGVVETTPSKFLLEQNYPNPWNPVTRIGYSVGVVSGQWSVAANVRLAVYDMLGREVAVLVDGTMPAGNYEVQFDGSGLSSGTYIYRLTAGERVETRKMVLMR